MRVGLVAPDSKLIGATCRCCPGKIRAGESVLWTMLTEVAYGEKRFVVHAACAARLADMAPEGRAPGNKTGKVAAARKALRAGADLFELV